MTTPETTDHTQARRIVRLAADGVHPDLTYPRSWLLLDELGSWERQAADLAAEGESRRGALGVSKEDMEQEIACVLRLRCLSACLAEAKELERDLGA